MKTMTREQAIRTYVEQLSGDDLANLLQHMHSHDGCFDDVVSYEMDLFDQFMDGCTPSEIARMIYFGEFDPDDAYFRYDGYGNLESLDWEEVSAEAEDLVVDIFVHLAYNYNGDTPWADLDYMVDADDTAIFNEDFEEVFDDDDE